MLFCWLDSEVAQSNWILCWDLGLLFKMMFFNSVIFPPTLKFPNGAGKYREKIIWRNFSATDRHHDLIPSYIRIVSPFPDFLYRSEDFPLPFTRCSYSWYQWYRLSIPLWKKMEIATENSHLVRWFTELKNLGIFPVRLPGRVTIKNPSVDGTRHAPGLCLASVRAPEEVGLATGVGLGLNGAGNGTLRGGVGLEAKKGSFSCLEWWFEKI